MTTETVQTQNWFFSAPYQYLTDQRLDIYDKAVYTVLCAHASAASKTAFPSAKTIAVEGSLSRAKVFVCLKNLEECGYIKRKQRFKVTVDKQTKDRRISNDTNEYTLVLPSTPDGPPPSPHDRLVHDVDYQPSPQGRLVHDVDQVPSPHGGHRTDIDFDYDLDNDDDKIIVHNLAVQLYQELVVTYKDLTLLTVCETMNRCMEHNPSDLYKYTKKAVVKELEDILKGVKAPKVNAANLKKKAKPKQQQRSGRKEQTPDWYEDADTYYANVGKPKEQKPSVPSEEAAKGKAEIDAMLEALK